MDDNSFALSVIQVLLVDARRPLEPMLRQRPDYFLFPRMKRELKRHRYDYIEAVQAALKSLNSIPETDLQRAFEVWQTRRTNCNDAGEMYFEDFSVIVMISAINFDFYNQSRHLLNEPCNMKMFQTHSFNNCNKYDLQFP